MTSSEELLEAELVKIEERADNASCGPWQAFIEGRGHL
jgi:hypothetical protein